MKDSIIQLAANTGINTEIGTPQQVGTTASADDLPQRVIGVINWVIGILGIVCVVVIIIGGIQYMTSTGDPGKVKKAKDTILYGIIGLVVVILAAAIVNFVIASLVQQ